MNKPAWIVVDRNYFARVARADPEGDLAEIIFGTYGCPRIADRNQLSHVNEYKVDFDSFQDHGITDEQAASFFYQISESIPIRKISKDIVDLKLLLYCQNNPGAHLLTCDSGLLRVSHLMNIPRACFKASLHYADEYLNGGILSETPPSYEGVADMLAPEPKESDPFFHFTNCHYCVSCDPNRACQTHAQPPTRPSMPS